AMRWARSDGPVMRLRRTIVSSREAAARLFRASAASASYPCRLLRSVTIGGNAAAWEGSVFRRGAAPSCGVGTLASAIMSMLRSGLFLALLVSSSGPAEAACGGGERQVGARLEAEPLPDLVEAPP